MKSTTEQKPDNNKSQRRYIVTGRVQRVGFRYAVYLQANALGLSGYTRNLSGGQVEICATGCNETLEKLRQWLHKGPVLARVESVEESVCDVELGSGFGIR